MYRDIKGKNYDASLSNKDVARIVKKELKTRFKDCKISATSSYSSVRVKISLDMDKYRARSWDDLTQYYKDIIRSRYLERNNISLETYLNSHPIPNLEAKSIEKEAKELLESYNYDRSDPYTDYFDVKFYGFVDIELIF